MKTKIGFVIPGMNEVWRSFPWDKFPGGVKVTFVLTPVGGGGVSLLRPTRWGYELPQQDLRPGDTIDHVVALFNQHLKSQGVSYRLGSKPPTVIGADHEGGVFHLVIQITHQSISGGEKIEYVPSSKAYQIVSGLALSNPMCVHVPKMLGWAETVTASRLMAAA